MIYTKKSSFFLLKFFLLIITLSFFLAATGQNTDTSKIHQYRPQNQQKTDSQAIWPTVNISQDTTKKTIIKEEGSTPDTLSARQIFIQDSIAKREAFIQDSIAKRIAFVQDSIAQREAFIRDSIAKRERIIDSLNFLRLRLPRLMEASLITSSEDIILHSIPVEIVGDSILSNYTYNKLVFNLSKPYTPWSTTINLSTRPVKFTVDTINKTVTQINFNTFTHKYTFNSRARILQIKGNNIVLNKRYGKLFNVPIDSVFYDAKGRITKIKRYHHYHAVRDNYFQGAPMYKHLKQVKQFEYDQQNNIAKYEVVNFCDRWRESDPHKVCNLITYTIQTAGNNYTVTRINEPSNVYSDGKFVFEYLPDGVLKSVEFKNNSNTENWKTFVEINEEGNVSRYVYVKNGIANRSLVINYYLDDPNAKYKVETISCTFEDDRVSYYQKNNMTGKSRVRDRLTLEWGPWQ